MNEDNNMYSITIPMFCFITIPTIIILTFTYSIIIYRIFT